MYTTKLAKYLVVSVLRPEAGISVGLPLFERSLLIFFAGAILSGLGSLVGNSSFVRCFYVCLQSTLISPPH